ncbi:hypothetical protein FJTKL_05010 [Diaporthe vaccinii]|uniref:Uncharacterized protein n=1 Tax=Diaporthe vaccinii TaxID=105482 RepID=A0ABR4EYU5_9PEZI
MCEFAVKVRGREIRNVIPKYKISTYKPPNSVKTKVVSSVQNAHTQPGIFCDSGQTSQEILPGHARHGTSVNYDLNKNAEP